LEAEKAGKKSHYSGKEVLFLKREEKGWKIIKGL
jgi:ketosteroid isomerase-like protein